MALPSTNIPSDNSISKQYVDPDGHVSDNPLPISVLPQLSDGDEPTAQRLLLRNISHNVHTAMNAIIGLTDISMSSGIDEAQLRPLQYVKNSAVILQAFLGHVMDLSQIESGQFQLHDEQFSLRETVENLGEVFTHELTAKKMSLFIWIHEDVPETLIGDPIRLNRILLSLVQHALNLCLSGHVLIEVQPSQISADRTTLQFSVLHTGDAFSLQSFQMDLKKYIRDSQPERIDLTPIELGLYITGRLLDHVGAQIWFGQKGKRYNSFNFLQTFMLPKSVEPKEKSLITYRIAIHCQNALLRRIIAHILRANHFIPTHLPDFALLKKTDPKFDVLIMDQNLLTNLKQKKLGPLSDIPIIAIDKEWHPGVATGLQLNEHTWRCHLPLTSHQLLSMISQALGIFDGDNYIEPLTELHDQVRILLVEDVYINQQVIKSLTTRPKLMLDIADDGQKALDFLAQTSYDLILMDLQMPQLDGYMTTQKIRHELNLRHIPIIALTAYNEQSDRDRCLLSGMNDFLSKPIEPRLFYRTLYKWLKKPIAS
jgi:two-component system, sensor histidine kinase and response regulator